jgi:hypothetical protein
MKKLVFTALAVVAFSVSAMAGTKEVKKAHKAVKSSENAIANKTFDGDCNLWAADTLDFADSNNELTPVQAHDAYLQLVEMCEKKMK